MSSPAHAPHAKRPRLVLILGDQLDVHSPALSDIDPARDTVWMAEVREESTHVPSSKQRSTLFLSAMRHFAEQLRARGLRVRYTRLDEADNTGSLGGELARAIDAMKPVELILTAPGDWRVLQQLRRVARSKNCPLTLLDDSHFFATVREFAAHAAGRKQLRLEYFYRELRRKTGILMNGDQPEGGRWNFDTDNRKAFGPQGPGMLPPPCRFAPDAITLEVMALVDRMLPEAPGQLDEFAWPVTRDQALQALEAFITERLPNFGAYQDALWQGEAWLYHSHLSAALNLKLLNPREVVQAAVKAYQQGRAPLASVEGFVRQILGWREYVRGIYWTQMPDYLSLNVQHAEVPLPGFFWTGETEMACLRDAITQSLRTGYAHHIQRLMVTGLYALLLGVKPQEVHAWYLGVYVDAVEWVELPNTLGMSQFADGGLMASKPYVASGQYIRRMSNHCQGCRYRPDQSTGPEACPFTTLYWDYLQRHAVALSGQPRMQMALKNLARLSPETQAAIGRQAEAHRQSLGA